MMMMMMMMMMMTMIKIIVDKLIINNLSIQLQKSPKF